MVRHAPCNGQKPRNGMTEQRLAVHWWTDLMKEFGYESTDCTVDLKGGTISTTERTCLFVFFLEDTEDNTGAEG